MKQLRTFALAAVLLGGLVAAPGQASVMPNGLSALAQEQASNVQEVRWICGPYGCRWRPHVFRPFGYRSLGFVGPRRWWGPRWPRWRRRWWY